MVRLSYVKIGSLSLTVLTALEGVTEAMSLELHPSWGIKVCRRAFVLKFPT